MDDGGSGHRTWRRVPEGLEALHRRRVAVGSRLFKPVQRTGSVPGRPVAFLVGQGSLKPCLAVAQLRSLDEEPERLVRVLLGPVASLLAQRKVLHRVREVQRGCARVPMHGLFWVFWNPSSVVVAVAEMIHRLWMSCNCRLGIPLHSLRIVAFDSKTQVVTHSDLVVRHSILMVSKLEQHLEARGEVPFEGPDAKLFAVSDSVRGLLQGCLHPELRCSLLRTNVPCMSALPVPVAFGLR
mmetsp:Transcript_12044/g.23668  ORF Transcript_12044/g.23668 Transcript_12044/m.23668 type:complete len:239 (+) Transcript_12044:717-1433(+)